MAHTAPPRHLPTMFAVESTNIEAIGFLFTVLDGGEIFVRFRSGETWKYVDCTRAEFDQLRAAKSVGGHFHQRIRAVKRGERVNKPVSGDG